MIDYEMFLELYGNNSISVVFVDAKGNERKFSGRISKNPSDRFVENRLVPIQLEDGSFRSFCVDKVRSVYVY